MPSTADDLAYPPLVPRIPIRAAPSGVTSVHVGVRPRIHPSRASYSLQRNQPDAELPLPLFSPLHDLEAVGLMDASRKTALSSQNQLCQPTLAEKAKQEYDTWLSKKTEREDGIAEEQEGYGTRDWAPRTRIVARPGAVEGIAHSEGYGDPNLRPQASSAPAMLVPTPVNEFQPYPWTAYGYHFPQYAAPNGQIYPTTGMTEQGNDTRNLTSGWSHDVDHMYPTQGYWDPNAYWWGMGMGMPNEPYLDPNLTSPSHAGDTHPVS